MELSCQYAYGQTRFVCDECLAVLRKALCEAYFANLTGSDAAILENGAGMLSPHQQRKSVPVFPLLIRDYRARPFRMTGKHVSLRANWV